MSGIGLFLGTLASTIVGNVLQQQQNKALLKQQSDENKGLYDYNNPSRQVSRLKQAGLNPALYYSGGAAGASIGQASTPHTSSGAEFSAAHSGRMTAQKQVDLMESERDVNIAQKKKLEESANKDIAETMTENEVRNALKVKMQADAVDARYKNYKTGYELSGEVAKELGGVNQINTYNEEGQLAEINELGYYFRKYDNEITQGLKNIANTEQDTQLKLATETLTNEKAKVVYQELLNGIKMANADMIRAKAQQLATEFNTGEYINWKTYVELGFKGADLIFNGLNAFTKAGVMRNLQNKVLNEIPK